MPASLPRHTAPGVVSHDAKPAAPTHPARVDDKPRQRSEQKYRDNRERPCGQRLRGNQRDETDGDDLHDPPVPLVADDADDRRTPLVTHDIADADHGSAPAAASVSRPAGGA